MSFQGMDVEAVEALADRIAGHAKVLRSQMATIDALVDEASSRWDGPGRTNLRSDWDIHRRNLSASADAIDALSKRALDNAAKQRNTSALLVDAAGGSGSLGATPTSTNSPIFPQLHALMDNPAWSVPGVAQFLSTVGNSKNLTGRYSAFSDEVIRSIFGTADAFRYKSTLNGLFSVDGFFDKLSRSRVPGILGSIGAGVTLTSTLSTWFDPESSNLARLASSMDAAAAGLKTKPGIAYLGGIALSSVSMAVDAADDADFSAEGWSVVAAEVAKDWTVIPESFLEATIKVGLDLPKVFF
ncbi:MAG: hypothetical protein LCH77_11355 [Actinobacteria bacterium]|nr:hypothetical protein [Actinomycetota bacterium]